MLVVRGGHELVGGVVEDELGGGRDDATVVAARVGDDERIGPVKKNVKVSKIFIQVQGDHSACSKPLFTKCSKKMNNFTLVPGPSPKVN